jgi:hypothetical protein
MLFFNFWYCGDLNNGGDWFHLADPYLFKIHLGMDPSNSFVQQHIPVTSTNEENIECDCPCSFSLIFNAWFCYISVNKRYICTSNKPVVFPGNQDQGCLRYYNVVRILCKFFQCWCLLVAPIVFLQLQQQFPISLKQIAFFADSPEYQQLTIMSQCCLKSMLNFSMTIGQDSCEAIWWEPIVQCWISINKDCLVVLPLWTSWNVKNFIAVLLVQILFSSSWSCTLLSQENKKKAHAICSLKVVGLH